MRALVACARTVDACAYSMPASYLFVGLRCRTGGLDLQRTREGGSDRAVVCCRKGYVLIGARR
jgi:hypothetical protein